MPDRLDFCILADWKRKKKIRMEKISLKQSKTFLFRCDDLHLISLMVYFQVPYLKELLHRLFKPR